MVPILPLSMAYEPLHHKYRPQSFAELVGQQAIATTLSNALDQQRIAPAYLFTGARGTGKTSSARIFAKSLNCINSKVPTPQPCGTCEVCTSITRGSALDVIEIDAASNTGVDNIRELIERAQFAPVQCRYKVYVIDEVHMLSTAAFNALLKTLEEPPDRVVFVLATTDPQKVLPTIISRCQRFDFRRIPLDDMVMHLTAIASKEGIAIADDSVQLVSQISQGGLRDAEALLDQLSLLDGEITIERVWDLVGAVPERELLDMLRAIASDDAVAVLDRARHLMDRGREPLIVLQNLAGFYRDLLIAKTAPQRQDLVAMTPASWAALCDFAATVDLRWIAAGQQHLRSSEVQVKTTTQPRLWLEVTLLGLLPSAVSAAPAASPAPTPTQQNSQTGKPASAIPVAASAPTQPLPAPVPPASPPLVAPSPVAEVLPPPVDSAPIPAATPDLAPAKDPNLHQLWQDVLEHLHPLSKGVLRDHGRLSLFDQNQALIEISAPKLFKIAQSKVSDIEKAFKKVVNHPVKVNLAVAAAIAEVVEPPPEEPLAVSSPIESPPFVAETPRTYEVTRPLPAPPVEDTVAPPVPEIPTTPSSAPMDWQAEEDIDRASKSLAQFFNGQIVNLGDGAPTDGGTGYVIAPDLALETDVEDDSDIPF